MQLIFKPDRCADRSILALLSVYRESLVTFQLMTSHVVQTVRPLRTCIYASGGKLIHPANLLVIQAKNTLYPIKFCCLTFLVYHSSDETAHYVRTVNSSLRPAGVTSLRTYMIILNVYTPKLFSFFKLFCRVYHICR